MRRSPFATLSALAATALLASGCAGLSFETGGTGEGGATPIPGYGAATGSGGGAEGGDDRAPNKTVVDGGISLGEPVEQVSVGEGPQPVCPDISQLVPKTLDQSFPSIAETASAPWARALLAAGALPDRSLLRTEEFLAYFTPPHVGEPSWELAVLGSPSSDTIDISVRASVPVARSEAVRLVVLVDVSPSMRDALPIARALVEALPVALSRDADRLAVLTYASDVVELAPLDEPSKAPAELDASPFSLRAGNDLAAALAGAATLGAEAPVHVLLVTDGGVPLDEGVLAQRAALSAGGHALSVALVGKPGRTGADAAPFPRAFADDLVVGRGQSFYLPDGAEPARVFAPAAFARAFGEMTPSTGFTLVLPGEFEVLGNVYLEKPAQAPGAEVSDFGGGVPSLAPGVTHPTWLRGSFCNAPSLFSADTKSTTKEELTLGLWVDLGGELVGADALEPSAWQVVSLDAPAGEGQAALFDLAVFSVLEVLRQRDVARVSPAREAIERAEVAAGCVGNPESLPHCASLAELSQMLDDAEPLL